MKQKLENINRKTFTFHQIQLKENEIINFIDINSLRLSGSILKGVLGYGLFINKKMVSILYYKKSTNFVIIDTCNYSSDKVNIIGCEKILFDKFISIIDMNNIVAYMDFRLCNLIESSIFINIGFRYDSFIPPSFYWYKNRQGRIMHDKSINEEEMISNKFVKIYNSGTVKFTYI